MHRLVPVFASKDILEQYRGTPVGLLFEYHNLGRPFDEYESAAILVGMCMDNRKKLNTPDDFAFIMRTGGANLRLNEFQMSYAVAVGGVKAIALIGHTHCGMVNLNARREQFIQGLIEHAGWEAEWAEAHFAHFAPLYEIGNEVDFILSETSRLRSRYPKILVAPLLYRIEDHLLYQIREEL